MPGSIVYAVDGRGTKVANHGHGSSASFHKTLFAGVGAVKRDEEGEGDTDRIRQPPTGAMDFSALNEALASNSYDKVADVCDDLMLRVAAEGVSFQDEWPYALHLLGYLFVNDM